MDMWSSPLAPPVSRPRPATIHEASFSYCLPEEFNGLPAWDSSTLPLQQTQNGYQQQGFNNQHDFYPSSIAGDSEHNWTPAPTENNVLGTEFGGWQQKSNDDMVEMDTDMTIGQAITTDEAIPVLDLRPSAFQLDHHYDQTFKSRPLSGSSFTMSTTGPLSEMTSFEDFSATMSDAHSFVSDYPPRSNRNSLMSSTQLSPVASPRMTPQTRSELVRTQSRGRASPSPRPTMRSAPYNMDSSRSKRWSTGSYATTPSRRQSPFVFNYGPQEMFSPLGSQRLPSHHSSPVPAQAQLPLNMSNLQSQQYPYLSSNNNAFQRNTMVLPSSTGYNDNSRFDAPAPLLSHGLFRMLQSNADPHSLHSHYADLSDPPDLYGALSEDQLQPPPEDMNPEDPDMIPHEQELRFPGDLYTPRWVRGHGNKREGWCGICKPGRWLVLKNSAFWYDKSFTHGISAATGAPFQEPGETRRMDGNPDVWEGSCGSCGDWVALVSSKKKGTTWFRHAYKVCSTCSWRDDS